MSDDERGLTDAASQQDEVADFVEDVPVEQSEEDYDFGAMVAGVRPNRSRVWIRPRSDLKETLEGLADRYRELEGREVPADVLEDLDAEWDRVKALYDQTFAVVIEGRTSDWQRALFRDLRKQGVDPDKKGISDQERRRAHERRLHAQIAAQIIHPTQGVTEDAISALAKSNEVEVEKLYQAVVQANTRPSGDVAFLRGRSAVNRSG